MARTVVYKYRSLANWRFVVDILVEHRLYAAPFTQLNDPMEGRYSYRDDVVTRAFRRAIKQSKDYWKICSLSEDPRNRLMWSYYGGGHTGIALGVSIAPCRDQVATHVSYDSDVTIGPDHVRRPPRDVAVEILSQKHYAWQHEQEFRVFSNAPFVRVDIKEIFLGCLMPAPDRELVMKLARKAAPRAKVRQLRRSDLDAPLV